MHTDTRGSVFLGGAIIREDREPNEPDFDYDKFLGNMPSTKPVVFISSTAKDLAQHREAAAQAARQAGFDCQMMEEFEAQSLKPPYAACMQKVRPCDVLIVLVAHRYGWVPEDQPDKQAKSITWLECEEALRDPKKEVLAFVIDPDHKWPVELKESYRATEALEKGKLTAKAQKEITRNVQKLGEFKTWLGSLGFRSTFTDTDSVNSEVEEQLAKWLKRHPDFHPEGQDNPAQYLRQLREETRWIDIRGLQVGDGKVYRFAIDDLYIPLTASRSESIIQPSETTPSYPLTGRRSIPLEELLSHTHVVIEGGPGSGKTTFLRRIAYELCRDDGKPSLMLPSHGFPIYIRIAHLEEHITKCRSRNQQDAPLHDDSPSWLVHFLVSRSSDRGWNLNAAFFEATLRRPGTTILLDGLDEASSRLARESSAQLLFAAAADYEKCRFVVTARPQAYAGLAKLSGFEEFLIDDLQPEAAETFLRHWSRSLFPSDEGAADQHWRALSEALNARAAIQVMARNPVMLTALAVVHWNERRLPEQRSDLYSSITNWLVRVRDTRPGRETPDRVLSLLGHLALGMQTQAKGRITQISKVAAAEMIAPHFHEHRDGKLRLERARAFLDTEEVDSGIFVTHGSVLSFWHLTLQEFLAARIIAGLTDFDQQKLLFADEKLYRPEWHELMLLLGGILIGQGTEKVDGLFRAMLDRVMQEAPILEKAGCVGLIGAMLSDLVPYSYKLPDPLDVRMRFGAQEISAGEGLEFEGLDVMLRLGLAKAATQFCNENPEQMRRLTIPVPTLLVQAFNHPDLRVRERLIGALLEQHYENREVRDALIQFAQASSNLPFRRQIERGFEFRFPAWKRWLAKVDGEDAAIPDFYGTTAVSMRVARIRLRNIRIFEDTGVIELAPRGSLFVGENSAGKTTLLRSITLAALGPALANQSGCRPQSYLRFGEQHGSIEVAFELKIGDAPYVEFVSGLAIQRGETAFRALDAESLTLALHNCASRLDSLRTRSEDSFGFLCAYGAFRTFSDPTSSLVPQKDQVVLDRVKSLFDQHASVIDPDIASRVFSGQFINFRRPPVPLSPSVLKAMQQHLAALLPGFGNSEYAAGSSFPIPGNVVPLRDLSDGYLSMVAMIGSLFHHVFVTFGVADDPASVSGILLIDEIDAHLHPSWQRRILPDLAGTCSNLQILATTHSPMVAASVDSSSVFHVVRSEESGRIEVRTYEMVLQGLEADEILTAPLFGLDDTRDLGTEKDEKRYDELRLLISPTESEVAERNELATKLFGHRADNLRTATTGVFDSLKESLEEKMKSDSIEEQARRLIEAERLIEKMLAGH